MVIFYNYIIYIKDLAPVKKICKILTKEELLEEEKEIDRYNLKDNFTYKKQIIKTYGDLRKICTTREIIESLESILDDDEYFYIYNWFLDRLYIKNYQ